MQFWQIIFILGKKFKTILAHIIFENLLALKPGHTFNENLESIPGCCCTEDGQRSVHAVAGHPVQHLGNNHDTQG